MCPLITGIALIRGLRAWESLVLEADTAIESGMPAQSDSTWIFEPDLPRSTGLDPVRGPFCPDRGSVQDCARPVDHALAGLTQGAGGLMIRRCTWVAVAVHAPCYVPTSGPRINM